MEERVSWIRTGTDLRRDALLGKGRILPRGGIASVERLTVALAMTSGRPEYMPVLIAATEATTEPLFKHVAVNGTTNATRPALIVVGQ
jgi:hypothetical protein